MQSIGGLSSAKVDNRDIDEKFKLHAAMVGVETIL